MTNDPTPPASATAHPPGSAAYPPKPSRGDRVAIVSAGAGLPGLLPMPYDLGIARLQGEFGLEPVEYPTTRRMGSTPQDRAADVNAAFADPSIRAVIASIGGDDQITVLRHLDHELIRADPKPFFGYSDNTNLLVYLANRGIVSFHGGSVMCELGRPGAIHPVTKASLTAALFEPGPFDIRPGEESRSIDVPWDDPRSFEAEPPMEPTTGWSWHQVERPVDGTLWGGNLEILSWLAMAGREWLPAEAYDGKVLLVETSEELPSAAEVFRILRNIGERGVLGPIAAMVVGRPKTWALDRRRTPEERETYAREQRAAILDAVQAYRPDLPIVFDLDVGHTDPQVVLPIGGRIRIDPEAERVTVWY